MHPLFNLFANQPQLLADHAQAYAELVATEVGRISVVWQRRVLLSAAALCGLAVAAVLAGVALMLWAVVPASQIHAPWVLIAAPAVPVVLAIGCLVAGRQLRDDSAADNLWRHLKADLVMLREASSPS